VKLIDAKSEGNFFVAEGGKNVLNGLDPEKNCNLVFIFGNARSGKSFMMNRLLTTSGGHPPFKVINTHDPCTRGVDISTYFVPHAQLAEAAGLEEDGDPDQLVGFVDVEGAGDQDATYDTMLALPLLLTGKVVLFNHKGAPTVSDMLERLGVLARAAEKVNLSGDENEEDDAEEKEDEDEGEEKPKKFGHLHILFRDFAFTGTQDSVLKQIMTMEKVKKALRKDDDNSYDSAKTAQERNDIRQLLIDNFESINVWLFKQPAKHDDLRAHAELPDDMIDVDFMNNVTELFGTIAEQTGSPAKFNGKKLTGPGLAQLFGQLTGILNSGLDINVPSVFRAMEVERMYKVQSDVWAAFEKGAEAFKSVFPCSADQLDAEAAALTSQLEGSFLAGMELSSLDKEKESTLNTLRERAAEVVESLKQLNSKGAWELVDEAVAQQVLQFRVSFKQWCHESMPVEDASELQEKFDQLATSHREALAEVLSGRVPQVLSDPQFETVLQTALAPVSSHLEVKKAENSTLLKEREMKRIQEEAAKAKQKLLAKNTLLVADLEHTRNKSVQLSSRLKTTQDNLTLLSKEKEKAQVEVQQAKQFIITVEKEKEELEAERMRSQQELRAKAEAIDQQSAIIAAKEEEAERLRKQMEETEEQLLQELEETKRGMLERKASRDAEMLKTQEAARRKLVSERAKAEEALLEEKQRQQALVEAERERLRQKEEQIEAEKKSLADKLREKEEALVRYQRDLEEKEAAMAKLAREAAQKLEQAEAEAVVEKKKENLLTQQREQVAKLEALEEEKRARAAADQKQEEEANFQVEGYLSKKGQFVRNWKRRYFRVRSGVLSYYEDKEAKDAKGSIAISKSTITKQIDPRETKKAYKHSFKIITDDRNIHCRADSDQEMLDWCRFIDNVASGISVHSA